MFANWTQETCTGTSDVLTCTGATETGAPEFLHSFADGDLVAYVVKDSGGIIKVSGIGTYVAATNSITRNDKTNWNGTVVDKNPATNIALSAGTHTISCDISASSTQALKPTTVPVGSSENAIGMYNEYSGTRTLTKNQMTLVPVTVARHTEIKALGFRIGTADAAALNNRIGIYKCDAAGVPSALIYDSGHIVLDVSNMRVELLASLSLPADTYFFAMLTDSDSVLEMPYQGFSKASPNYIVRTSSSSRGLFYRIQDVLGALPADASNAQAGLANYGGLFGWKE